MECARRSAVDGVIVAGGGTELALLLEFCNPTWFCHLGRRFAGFRFGLHLLRIFKEKIPDPLCVSLGRVGRIGRKKPHFVKVYDMEMPLTIGNISQDRMDGIEIVVDPSHKVKIQQSLFDVISPMLTAQDGAGCGSRPTTIIEDGVLPIQRASHSGYPQFSSVNRYQLGRTGLQTPLLQKVIDPSFVFFGILLQVAGIHCKTVGAFSGSRKVVFWWNQGGWDWGEYVFFGEGNGDWCWGLWMNGSGVIFLSRDGFGEGKQIEARGPRL